jgi:hypothetical protein
MVLKVRPVANISKNIIPFKNRRLEIHFYFKLGCDMLIEFLSSLLATSAISS